MYCHNCGKTLEPDTYHIVTTVIDGQAVTYPECREPCQHKPWAVRITAGRGDYKYSKLRGVK
jgi:hypothetical protein